jgi:hypothetical protein
MLALLIEQNHFDEAEELYRIDLGISDQLQRCAQHPDNIWALHGLVECLRQLSEKTLLPQMELKLNEADTMTDTLITSSCCCRSNGPGATQT